MSTDQVKERPIPFSAPMVRAILAGTKTQTRRALRDDTWLDPTHGVVRMCNVLPGVTGFEIVDCPYGQPGDRLWVRETFYCDHCFYPHGTPPSCYWDGDKPRKAHTPEQLAKERADMLEAMYYRADGDPDFEGAEGPTPWRPSIHMPRWASRITLEVTEVRVERLQDISDTDAWNEGIDASLALFMGCTIDAARAAYGNLWESIHGPGSWDANPLVWCVSFKRLT